ncbi:hypothetical protein TKK_0003096 [Trichogramma kaykai]|uniref:PRANC domain-containing protein n=1 Tax=Trichogramma kaykai TaxID=54128 RepID=A0ABD2WSZ5_9HYME
MFDYSDYSSDENDEIGPEERAERHQENVESLMNMREKVDWKSAEDRRKFIGSLSFFLSYWRGPIPNLRDIFKPEEIECLLSDAVNYRNGDGYNYAGNLLIHFVTRSGYKNELKVDKNGEPLVRHTTAVHQAAKRRSNDWVSVVWELFKIYSSCEANYTDESGLTHFHVACMSGVNYMVEKFLELGQDPNCIVRETGDSPLHLALGSNARVRETIELLLENGGDPNLANEDGSTPLHIICKREKYFDDGLTEFFFKINKEVNQLVQVDAKDKLGRTPLQWAVANLSLHTVNVLLANGADLSNFVFPTEDYLAKDAKRCDLRNNMSLNFQLTIAAGSLIIVKRLEKSGYELDEEGALTIMKIFAKYGLFKKSSDPNNFLYDEDVVTVAKQHMIKSSLLSLYDFIQLRPEEAAKICTYSDYLDFASSSVWRNLPKEASEAYAVHLCEITSKGFFRRWALHPLMELTGHQLPILCCEIIMKKLTNEDLWRICLTAANQSS